MTLLVFRFQQRILLPYRLEVFEYFRAVNAMTCHQLRQSSAQNLGWAIQRPSSLEAVSSFPISHCTTPGWVPEGVLTTTSPKRTSLHKIVRSTPVLFEKRESPLHVELEERKGEEKSVSKEMKDWRCSMSAPSWGHQQFAC